MSRKKLDSIEGGVLVPKSPFKKDDLDKVVGFIYKNARLSVGLILTATMPQVRKNLDAKEICVLSVLHHMSYPMANLMKLCNPSAPMTNERLNGIHTCMKRLTAGEISSVLVEEFRNIHRFEKVNDNNLKHRYALQNALEMCAKKIDPIIPSNTSGNWSVPKGAPKSQMITRYRESGNGETVREAIVREMREETALNCGTDYEICSDVEPIDFEFEGGGSRYRYVFYMGKLTSDNIPYGMYYDHSRTFAHSSSKNREIARVAFVPINGINRFLPPSYGDILRMHLNKRREDLSKVATYLDYFPD